MNDLHHADLQRFSGALEQIYTLAPIQEFSEHVFRVIESLIPESVIATEDIDLATGTHALNINVRIDDPVEYINTLAENVPRDHPAVHYNMSNPANPMRFWRLNDLISQRQFEQTGLYWDQFKPLGVRYQLGIFPDVPGHVVGFTINHAKKFSDREAALIRMLAPHIIRAHSNAARFSALQTNAASTPAFSAVALHRAGFTPREAEVLHWVMEGKRNGEIAVILGSKTRTIAKHVENILAKLGVETRTAAAARAMEILRIS